MPRNDSLLKLNDIKTFSEPKALVDINDRIIFSWDRINTTLLRFWIVSKVSVSNEIIKIKDKIDFPIFTDEYKEYTKETKFIDINSDIYEKAHEIVKGEDDLYVVVFNIAEWVKSNIKYDLNTLTETAVQKSSWVFQNKEGVCDEMTNLFISMLRSVGIPARFVSGTVYSNIISRWGNHGWAEVYFPDYGWVPFDVTFGQYGWVDVSHLKLSDTADSGESSVEYNWRSRNIDLNVSSINIDTNLINVSGNIGNLFELRINTLEEEKFGIGSYVPIQITVTNLNNFYLSTTISLTKAPELIGSNFKDILLKPKETRSFYFIGKIQNDLNEKYEYSSVIEVKDSFGSSDFYNLLINNDSRVFNFVDVKEITDKLIKRELKKSSPELNLDCKPNKKNYYIDEEMFIECKIRNKGNTLLNDVNVCLKSKCYKNDLRISEDRIYNFITKPDKNVLVTAETEDLIKKSYIEPEIIEVPDIFLSGLNPLSIKYFDNTSLNFTLNSKFKAYNVSVLINNIIYKELNDISGDKEVSINIFGKDLVFKKLDIFAVYYDKIGNKYTKKLNFNINILDLPWYIKIIKFITFSK